MVCACLCGSAHAQPALQVELRTTPADKPLDGRLLLLLSTDDKAEPRTQIDPTLDSQLVFGADIEDLRERTLTLPARAFTGYPIRSLADVAPGTYNVQVVLHVYETVRRADGHTLKLPMDRGEGQKWNRAPGNPDPAALPHHVPVADPRAD